MFDWLYKTLFWALGWKLQNSKYAHQPKALFVVAPHNTWIDFVLGLSIRASLGLTINYLGKKELFDGPFGWFFRATGGTPLNRTKSSNMVDVVVGMYNQTTILRIGMAPEGTRKNVSELRTGFYYIALKANVPMIFTGFDFSTKTVIFSEPFYATGSYDLDKKIIARFFATIGGYQKDWVRNYLTSEIKIKGN